MLRRGVSENQRYQRLFQDWEIAIAKRLINEFRHSMASLKNEDLEDLLQECLLQWYISKEKYNPERGASIKTYMARVVRNKLIDLVRERESDKRKISHTAVSLDKPLSEGDSRTLRDELREDDSQDLSRDSLSNHEISIDLRKAFGRLNPKQRKLCYLLGQKGITLKEASELLKTPRTTIYDEIKRIRAIFMKEGLNEYVE